MRWVQALKMLMLTAIGCTSNNVQQEGGDGEGTEGTDTALPPVCTESQESFVSVSAELTEMPTVARATWETVDLSVEALVTFWVDGEEEKATSTPTTTLGTRLLLGLHQNQTYQWKVTATLESGDVVCSEEQTLETGEFEYELPDVTLDYVNQAEASDGYIITEMILAEESFETSYAVIIDKKGEYVWAWHDDEIGPVIWRARLSLDGESILVLFPDHGLVSIPLDGSPATQTSSGDFHSDFVELPDGRLAALVWETAEYDGREYKGSQIIEMESDGTGWTKVWSSFDQWEVDPLNLPWFCTEDILCPYAHVNFLSYHEEEDAYYVTALYLPAVARIDRDGGSESWSLQNAGQGDFPAAPADLIAYPHSVYPMGEEEILVFNEHIGDGSCSEASLIGVDREEGRAWEEWSYSPEECPRVYFLGEAIPIEDDSGNILVVFSTEGRIDQASPTGETLWRVSTEEDWFGFSQFVTSLYKE